MKQYDTHKVNLKDILENDDPNHPTWQRIISTPEYKEFENTIDLIINRRSNDLGNT